MTQPSQSSCPPSTETPPQHKHNINDDDDHDFQIWIETSLVELAPQLVDEYQFWMKDAARCITKWRQRYRGNPTLWNRLFKASKVLKEVLEGLVVVREFHEWIAANQDEKVTILDLCSGKGYLSMWLSESLPPDRVEQCVLMDKAWPLCHAEPQPHHMSWEHIYGDYYETWPIPLVTSKQDFKQAATLRQLGQRYGGDKVLLLVGIHLCGTLSLQAIRLFVEYLSPQAARLLMLKPCCLPNMWHVRHAECFVMGSYSFPTASVCTHGRWLSMAHATETGNRWKGPPRWQLQGKFETWCGHLQQSLDACGGGGGSSSTNDDDDNGATTTAFCGTVTTCTSRIQTRRLQVAIQTKGGYQNVYLVAERTKESSQDDEGV